MAVYAFGDLQGCYDTFQRLLRSIEFRPGRDRIWLAGDLVAKGPKSLEVLRWCVERADSVVAVLGNHDLGLLALADGLRGRDSSPELLPVLDAPDAAALIGWLRTRPLLHVEDGVVLLHAGLLPEWDLAEARSRSRAVEALLQGPEVGRKALLSALRPRSGRPWADVPAPARAAYAANVLTALRVVDDQGVPDFGHSGGLWQVAPGSSPWFRRSEVVGRYQVVCGHWAVLGFHRESGFAALDSGCVYGRRLTALRLDDGAVFQEQAID